MASISDIRALLRSRAETRNFVGYPVGRIPSPSLAVHSWGRTTLHEAAYYGNRRIVRLLIDAEADVDVRDDDGRAFPLLRHRRMGRPNHAVCRAGARRCTGPRRMAISKRSRSCSCAAPPWSGTVGGNAAPSRTADRRRTPMRAGARRSNGRSNEGSSRSTRRRRRRCTQEPARRLSPPPRASYPIPPRPAYADGCAAGACRPSALAVRAESLATPHTTLAL